MGQLFSHWRLVLLRNSLDCLPWNPFHFEIDDILYLHESLQPNVNAFLADLFQFFEPIPIQSPGLHVALKNFAKKQI
jgi:hypothetical protein